MSLEVKDDVKTKFERATGFIKHHVELLDQAIKEGDLHTADFLCGVLERSIFDIHKEIRLQLGRPE